MSEVRPVQSIWVRYQTIALILSLVANVFLFLYARSVDSDRNRLTIVAVALAVAFVAYVWVSAEAGKIDFIKIANKKILPSARKYWGWKGTMQDVTYWKYGDELFYQLHSPASVALVFSYDIPLKTINRVDTRTFDAVIRELEKSDVSKAIKLDSEIEHQKKKQLKKMGLEEKDEEDE